MHPLLQAMRGGGRIGPGTPLPGGVCEVDGVVYRAARGRILKGVEDGMYEAVIASPLGQLSRELDVQAQAPAL